MEKFRASLRDKSDRSALTDGNKRGSANRRMIAIGRIIQRQQHRQEHLKGDIVWKGPPGFMSVA